MNTPQVEGTKMGSNSSVERYVVKKLVLTRTSTQFGIRPKKVRCGASLNNALKAAKNFEKIDDTYAYRIHADVEVIIDRRVRTVTGFVVLGPNSDRLLFEELSDNGMRGTLLNHGGKLHLEVR